MNITYKVNNQLFLFYQQEMRFPIDVKVMPFEKGDGLRGEYLEKNIEPLLVKREGILHAHPVKIKISNTGSNYNSLWMPGL